jgi:hypothetical protein
MKTRFLSTAVTLALASGVVLAQPRWNAPTTPPRAGAAVTATVAVTAEAKAALLEALTGEDGEYAAYATYDAVVKKFGQVEPYLSIRNAEAQHIEALTRQLELRGIAVPANPYLGKVTLQPTLLEQARHEVADEQANVAMYDRLLKTVTGDAQLTRVFTNLRAASQENHLKAFAAAEKAGGSLTAAQMTAFHNDNYAARQAAGFGRGQGFGAGQGPVAGPGPAQGFGPGAGRGFAGQGANVAGRGPGFGRGPRR